MENTMLLSHCQVAPLDLAKQQQQLNHDFVDLITETHRLELRLEENRKRVKLMYGKIKKQQTRQKSWTAFVGPMSERHVWDCSNVEVDITHDASIRPGTLRMDVFQSVFASINQC